MGKATKTIKSGNLNSLNKYMKYILLALISVFIIVIPFYRGLYFRENYIPAIIFISLLYSAHMVYKLIHKDYKIIDTYMDVAVILIPIAYLISFFFGVNAKDGLDAVLIYSSYFMIYRIASDLSRNDEKIKNMLLNVIIASTFITAITSILAASGLISLNGVIVGNRIYGLYQYTNTTASVLTVGIILSINSLINTMDIRLKLIYQVVLITLLSTFIFILSRGAFLALGAVLLLNFLVISAKLKLSFITSIFITLAANVLFVYRFFTNDQAEFSHIMTNYILSLAICLALTMFFHILLKRLFENINEKRINIILIVLLLTFIGGIAFVISVKEPIEYRVEHKKGEKESWKNQNFHIKNIEKETDYALELNIKSSLENTNNYGIIIRSYNIKDEFKELFKEFNSTGDSFKNKKINFTTLEDTDRLLFLLYNYEADSYTVYKDIILTDSLGNVVKEQERFKYIPDVIANRLSDINLETQNASLRITFAKDGIRIFKDNMLIGAGGGAWKNLYRQYQSMPYNSIETHNFFIQYATEVGLIGLLALAALLIQVLIGFIKCIRSKSSYLSVYLAVLLIFMHSTIDFNLSLAAVAYILWLLIGILNTHSSIKQISLSQKKWAHIVLMAISIFIVVVSFSINYGIRIGNSAAKLSNTDVDKSVQLYEKAMKADKYNSDYRVDYAQIMQNKFKDSSDSKCFVKMLNQIELVEKYEPYNHKYTPILINLLVSNGKLDEAVAMADNKLKNEPMLAQSYIIKVDLNYEIARYFFQSNEHEKSIPYLNNMIKAKEEYDAINSKLSKPIALPKDYDMKTDLVQNWIEQANRIMNRK